MTHVIYTPDIFSLQRVGGISRYICELIQRVPDSGLEVKAVTGIHLNRHLRRLPARAGIYVPKLGPLGNYRLPFNQAICRRIAARTPSAVIHSTYYSNIEYPASHPLVLTVYDMIEELFPEPSTRTLSEVKRRHCERADHIIAISATTKKDLIAIFNLPPEKITVIHLGDSLPEVSSRAAAGNPESYLLFAGVRKSYKNFTRFLEAFATSPFLKERFDVVAFGGGGFSEDEKDLIDRLKLAKKVRFASGDDGALAFYYRNAAALIFPSLYEGFGLPVLEAMGQNCPVICSNAGSLREIGEDAAAYFDPCDVDNMRQTMEQTLGNTDRLSELRRLGSIRKKLFSWDKCARQTFEVYREVAARHATKRPAPTEEPSCRLSFRH
jgi:glycosyltransferase involved in cell wall biosynthesis